MNDSPSQKLSNPRKAWLASLAALLVMAAAIALGLWQLNRAAQKEAITAKTQLRAQLPSWDTVAFLREAAQATSPQLLSELHYHRAHLQGAWLDEKTVYLENRQMHGHPGFFVLTPFKLADSEQALLVQRGWAGRNFLNRTALPNLPSMKGEQTIDVTLTPPPARLYAFGGAEQGKIRQNVELQALAKELGVALLPLSAQQLKGELADSLQRDWTQANFGVEKHYGYAAQWFGLSALSLALLLWFRWIKPRLEMKKSARSDKQ